MQPRTAQNSLAVSTHIVLPNDTNFHNNLFGGMLMSWVDIIASVAARRHCNKQVVTASINSISFDQPIRLGDTVTLEAKVSRSFNSSMEIYIDVWVQNLRTGVKHKSNEAISTFVALNEEGKPTMNWTLNNAWPTKITSTGMKSDDSTAAIDQLDVAFETMVIGNANNA